MRYVLIDDILARDLIPTLSKNQIVLSTGAVWAILNELGAHELDDGRWQEVADLYHTLGRSYRKSGIDGPVLAGAMRRRAYCMLSAGEREDRVCRTLTNARTINPSNDDVNATCDEAFAWTHNAFGNYKKAREITDPYESLILRSVTEGMYRPSGVSILALSAITLHRAIAIAGTEPVAEMKAAIPLLRRLQHLYAFGGPQVCQRVPGFFSSDLARQLVSLPQGKFLDEALRQRRIPDSTKALLRAAIQKIEKLMAGVRTGGRQ